MGSRPDITAFYAWGYYTAAIMGEVPAVISKAKIMDWIDTQPWSVEMCGKLSWPNYQAWRIRTTDYIATWLTKNAANSPRRPMRSGY